MPVDDPELQARLQEILDVNLADDTLAWELLPDGRWRKPPPPPPPAPPPTASGPPL